MKDEEEERGKKKNRYVTLSDAIDEKFRDNRKKLLGETKLKT